MNLENFNQLQLDIQKKVGFQIETLTELKMVQEKIEWDTKKKISFNTLRRFFGFLTSTNPNLKTLNTLSQFVGYESYNAYLNKNLQDAAWFNWIQTIKIELSNALSDDDIQWLASKKNTFDYHLQIASIVKTLIYKKNFGVLNQFFNKRVFQFDEPTQLKLAANVCLILRSLTDEDVEALVKNTAHNQLFRENILHWFVDYSYFNGYYGKFIKESQKYAAAESHEALFYDLILSYNDYLSCKSRLKLIPIHRINSNFYIVLQGRCYAYNLLYFSEQSDTVEYEKIWSSFLKKLKITGQANMLTIEIFPVLLLLKDFEKTNYLIQNYYEDLLTLANWSGYTSLAMILIAQSLLLIKQGKFKEATKGFELIDVSRFNLHYTEYAKCFFLIAKFHLAIANSMEASKVAQIQMEYESIAFKTGFKIFSIPFLTHYFSNCDSNLDAAYKPQ